ncbi:MAG: hypothetical protein WCP97_02325 [bacterium]
MHSTHRQFERGSSLMEVIIAIVLFSLVALYLFTLMLDSYRTNFEVLQDGKALTIADEGYEAILSIRDRNWSGVASNGVYGLMTGVPGYWSLVPGSNVLDEFTRAITIEDAYRDGTGKLVISGTPDPNTKKVTTTVSWSSGTRTRNVVIDNYLTNWVKSSLIRNGSFAQFSGSPPSVAFGDWEVSTTGGYSVEADTGYDTFGVAAKLVVSPLGVPSLTMQQGNIPVSGASAYTLSFLSKGTMPGDQVQIGVLDQDGYYLNQVGGWQNSSVLFAGALSHTSLAPTTWVPTTISFVTRPQSVMLSILITPQGQSPGEYVDLDTISFSKT